jgi:predicted nucleic acid-binding protein
MKPASIVVPDTSVLLKWALQSEDEGDHDKALELRDAWLTGRCTIVLPSLWFFEAGNILGIRQPALAPHLMRILTGYRFEEEVPAAIFEKAFDLMKKFKVTFYDDAFHAVAIRRSGTMITADDVYFRKASRAGHIGLLANWDSTRLSLK